MTEKKCNALETLHCTTLKGIFAVFAQILDGLDKGALCGQVRTMQLKSVTETRNGELASAAIKKNVYHVEMSVHISQGDQHNILGTIAFTVDPIRWAQHMPEEGELFPPPEETSDEEVATENEEDREEESKCLLCGFDPCKCGPLEPR